MRIGIDTGGTYTDAVLCAETPRSVGNGATKGPPVVLAKAKARTRVDLSVGIAEALDGVLAAAELEDRSQISLVSLSTTLATNALVEGIGGRVALVFIGFTAAELDRGGLRQGLGDAPVVMADGGHDSLGVEIAPFDAGALVEAAAGLEVDAFAVAGQFSVRNPAHELAAREALAGLGKPVACGHELSAKLNGPKRALTCLLNARLIGLITELCRAAESILARRGITAPLMIVRGDGSLVSAAFAEDRPIETILSGPAASLIGAGHLTGETDIVVSDIGGTTTDVGVLRRGRPTISVEGATVGGHRTMVEAVEVFTFGLGGDSEVRLEDRTTRAKGPGPEPVIGPRRMTPLALLAADQPALVHRTLDRRVPPLRKNDTVFAVATGRGVPVNSRQRRILDGLGDGWLPVDEVATTNLETSALRALVAAGSVRLAGFTPTDAAGVLGLHDAGDVAAAIKAAELLAVAPDGSPDPALPDGASLARLTIDTLVRRSAQAVLSACLTIDGFPAATVESALVQRALDGHDGATAVTVGVAGPLVGLGASAATYYPAVAALLGADSIIPEHAEVANAIGAAIGSVRIARHATVSQPSKGQFRIHLPGAGGDRGDLEPTIERTVELLTEEVRGQAAAAGATELSLEVDVERRTADVGGRELFVEATVTVIGTGPPKTA